MVSAVGPVVNFDFVASVQTAHIATLMQNCGVGRRMVDSGQLAMPPPPGKCLNGKGFSA